MATGLVIGTGYVGESWVGASDAAGGAPTSHIYVRPGGVLTESRIYVRPGGVLTEVFPAV